MMKNKTTKYVVNGVLLAALAAIGIAAFQLGTSPSKEENAPEEVRLESAQAGDSTNEEEEPLVDAGTSQVEADMEAMEDTEADMEETDQEEEATEGTESSDSADMEATEETAEETVDTSAGAAAAPVLNFSEDTPMEWPVNGNILLDYSMDQTTYFPTLDQYKLSPAIAVQAVEGAPVMAAVSGTVFSVEQDAQTGTTVTMELGNGYQAVYGQLTDLTVEEGDTVQKGTIIGYIGAPTKYYSSEGSNLYFAMKKKWGADRSYYLSAVSTNVFLKSYSQKG